MTDEQRVLSVLDQQTFTVRLGGKEIELRPATLQDLQRMSAKNSILPTLEDLGDDNDNITPQLIESFQHAQTLAEIIAAMANVKSRIWFKPLRPIHTYLRQRKVYKLAYKEANFIEIRIALIEILKRSYVFFYQNAIITLRGMSHLKKTKKTEAIVHGQ